MKSVSAADRLHRLAYRLAAKKLVAVSQSAVHGEHPAPALDDSPWPSVSARLDEAVNRLPMLLRVVMILRRLERRSVTQIARELGRSRRSVERCLAKAEKLVCHDLGGDGVVMSRRSLASMLASRLVPMAIPATLAHDTVRSAIKRLREANPSSEP